MCPPVGSRTQPDACPSLLTADAPGPALRAEPPACWSDLHLDDVTAAMALGPFELSVWHTPLADAEAIAYRQDVVAELRLPEYLQAASDFTRSVAAAREGVAAAASCTHPVAADLYRLEATVVLTSAVVDLEERLAELRPRSAGLRRVASHLAGLVRSPSFTALVTERDAVVADLRGVPFELGLDAGTVWVEPDTDRPSWADGIAHTFARFSEHSQAAPVVLPTRPVRRMNHVEARVVDLVAQLWPEAFARLRRFVADGTAAPASDVFTLADELSFYVRFLQLADSLTGVGVRWCLPERAPRTDGAVRVEGLVDLGLALTATASGPPLVPNDLELGPGERVVFLTGPNEGGKTTFARAVGVVAYLASLGLPVPARSASLPVLSPVLCHNPRPEDLVGRRGALADELVRLRRLLEGADAHALVLLNELFSSTSLQDASELAPLVLRRFDDVGCLVLWVTIQDELVAAARGAVSLVGQVAEDDPTRPTFRFLRQPPAGRSRAAALAARHGLGAADVAGRLR